MWESNYCMISVQPLTKVESSLTAETLPEQLVWYRKTKGWTQKAFTEVLGVDQSTLAGWERGEWT